MSTISAKQDGDKPQPGPSACAVDSKIKRLKQKNWNEERIMKNREFKEFRLVLNGKAIQLR